MATLYDPIKIGTLEMPNRMAAAPTAMLNSTEDGYMTDRAIRSFQEEARGGWGLLQVTASWVHPEGSIFRAVFGIHNDKSIYGHNRLVRAIHREGTKCSLQFFTEAPCVAARLRDFLSSAQVSRAASSTPLGN